MFTQVACSLFGTRGETYGAIVLTAITLFMLLPKNIGVTNAERVARLMVPPITLIRAESKRSPFSHHQKNEIVDANVEYMQT